MGNIELNNAEHQSGGEKSVSPQAGREYIEIRTRQTHDKLYKFLDSGVPIGIGAAGTGVLGLLFLKISEAFPTDMRVGAGLAIAGLGIGYMKMLWDKSRQDSLKRQQGKE